MTVAQIFVGGPHNRVINLTSEESAALRDYIRRTRVQVIAHSSYACHPWKGDPHAAEYIREELRLCQATGISGLVVHLPKKPASGVLEYLPRLVEPAAPGVRVYLETPANVPAETYYETPEKLETLFRGIRQLLDPNLDLFGLCVDTAHLHVAGVDLAQYASASSWLKGLATRLPELLGAGGAPKLIFHLNDSLRDRGKGPDTHAPLAKGKIWAGLAGALEESGLCAVADFARDHGSWVVLERKPNASLSGDYRIMRGLLPELSSESE